MPIIRGDHIRRIGSLWYWFDETGDQSTGYAFKFNAWLNMQRYVAHNLYGVGLLMFWLRAHR